VDKTGAVWTYKPPRHKNAFRGKPRTIQIGPLAQKSLAEFATANPGDYLFSPALAVEEFRAVRAAARKTPRSKTDAKTQKPTRTFEVKYNTDSYGLAIDRACDRAFPAPAPLRQLDGETAAEWNARLTVEQREELRTWQKANRWAPNQLRHTYATTVRAQHGLEAAQVLLGHSKADMTELYTAQNDALAASVAAQIG